MIKFFVEGIPAPQGSKVLIRGRMIESSKKLKPWREAVRQAAAEHVLDEPLDGPLSVSIDFYLPKPKKTKFGSRPAGKPDADKLARAVNDALTESGLIVDDARVVSLHVHKRWAFETPGAIITVEPLWDALKKALSQDAERP